VASIEPFTIQLADAARRPFAPTEEPASLARDIVAFFGDLRGGDR
jgi:hypothetical protein